MGQAQDMTKDEGRIGSRVFRNDCKDTFCENVHTADIRLLAFRFNFQHFAFSIFHILQLMCC